MLNQTQKMTIEVWSRLNQIQLKFCQPSVQPNTNEVKAKTNSSVLRRMNGFKAMSSEYLIFMETHHSAV